MNNTYKTLITIALLGVLMCSAHLFAGNKDRSGQAGAQHLLIDPWAKSSGWGTAGVAETRGLESVFSNIAGLSFVNSTEFGFSRTQYITGSDAGIAINSFGIAQALGKRDKETGTKIKDFGVLGVTVFAMNFGDIDITTVDQPEGNMGTFSPSYINIGIHYAKSFNRYIHGGFTGRIINESISDLKSTGFVFDIGVQYLSGAYNNFKIGVVLKNIGLPMRYSGDGISIPAVPSISTHELTLEQRSAEFEMPALLTIGLSYDFLVWGKGYKDMSKEEREAEGLTRDDADHRITLAGSFTANAYSRDLFALGIEYSLLNIFVVRAGYNIEGGMWNEDTRTSFYAGPSAGASFLIPLAKKGKGNQKLILDYAYRFTNSWSGNHYVSLKVAL